MGKEEPRGLPGLMRQNPQSALHPMLLGLKYITWDLGASHLQAALPMVRTWGWGAWDQQFLSSPSTSPICPISFFSSTGQNVPSWFPDARSMCPSRTTEQRMRAWESESNWSQTASRWWQKQNAYVCMVMSEVINKRKKKKKKPGKGRSPAFVSYATKGYPEFTRVYHWQH